MEDAANLTVDALLRQALAGRPELADAAVRIFEYARFLLDDDANLTRTGNLSGAADEMLRRRILELIGVADDAPTTAGEDAPAPAGKDAP